jgi:hypothetical protein
MVIVRPELPADACPGAPAPAGTCTGVVAGAIGRSPAGAGFDIGAAVTAAGGRLSFCHASHNSKAEKEKITNRMSRWVSMTARVTTRRGAQQDEEQVAVADQGTGS